MPALRRVSGRWRAHPHQGETCGFGQRVLPVVEGEKASGGNFDRDCNVKQVHRAHRHSEGVARCQLTGGAHSVRPANFRVLPVTEPNLLFEQAYHLVRLALPDQTGPFSLIEAVENLNPVPRSPQDLSFRTPVEQGDGHRVVSVPPAFVSQPPGGIGVTPQFLSECKNAAPSNLGALGLPTARFSASCGVIRGGLAFGVRSLVWPGAVDVAVFMQRKRCLPIRPPSRRAYDRLRFSGVLSFASNCSAMANIALRYRPKVLAAGMTFKCTGDAVHPEVVGGARTVSARSTMAWTADSRSSTMARSNPLRPGTGRAPFVSKDFGMHRR